nr:CMF_HP1_G0048410.mRNA.1.CDS.1 [Saccharomyces cerevisiae]
MKSPRSTQNLVGSGDLISAINTDSVTRRPPLTQLSLAASLAVCCGSSPVSYKKRMMLNIAFEQGPTRFHDRYQGFKADSIVDILKQDLIPSIGKPETIKTRILRNGMLLPHWGAAAAGTCLNRKIHS